MSRSLSLFASQNKWQKTKRILHHVTNEQNA